LAKSHRKQARYKQMWDAGLLLDKYRSNPISFIVDSTLTKVDKLMIYFAVINRVIALTAFFTLKQLNETASIKINNKDFIHMDDGIIVYIIMKSYQNRDTQVFIPKIEDNNICPVYNIKVFKVMCGDNSCYLFAHMSNCEPSLLHIPLSMRQCLSWLEWMCPKMRLSKQLVIN
jgi:hypothetical protein